MEEIKVGEYVRTDKGTIAKIEDEEFDIKYRIGTGQPLYLNMRNDRNHCFENILKHSFDIKDLIRKGDFVNEMEVDEFDDVEGNLYLGFPIYDDSLMDCISEFRPLETVEIKSIVTKEQFDREKYVVGE